MQKKGGPVLTKEEHKDALLADWSREPGKLVSLLDPHRPKQDNLRIVLRWMRWSAGLTQTKVAQGLHISHRQYCRYEWGQSPCPESLIPKLAEFYQVPLSEFAHLQE